MALTMSSATQQVTGAPCARMLKRTTFTGTPVALAPRAGVRSSLPLKSMTPQALFSRNKEQKVQLLYLDPVPACREVVWLPNAVAPFDAIG